MRGSFAGWRLLWSLVVGALACVALSGCSEEPEERDTPRQRTVDEAPTLASEALEALEREAAEHLDVLHAAVSEFSDAMWGHDFEGAQQQIIRLKELAAQYEFVASLVERYETYLRDEQRAFELWRAAVEAEDFQTVQDRVQEAEQAHTQPQHRRISRVLTDETMLPERQLWLQRERVAQRPWRQYRSADSDLDRARALAVLLTVAPESARAAEARQRLDELWEAALEEAVSQHEAGNRVEALRITRHWRSMLNEHTGVAELAEPFADLNERLTADPGDEPTAGGRFARMGERAVELLGVYAELLELRYEGIEGDELLERFLRQLARYVSGTPVPVPPVPILRHYRAAGDTLYDAGEHERLQAMLDTYFQEMRNDHRREAERAAELARYYRERAMYDARRGNLDPLDAPAIWNMDRLYWAGARNEPNRVIRTEARDARAVWPDQTLGELELDVSFQWQRARKVTVFIRGDRYGRGGVMLELVPIGGSGTASLSGADGLRTQVRLFDSERSSNRMDSVTLDNVRSDEVQVRIRAVGSRLEVRVNQAVAYRSDEVPSYLAQATGMFGLVIEGARPRVELTQVSLRVPEEAVAELAEAPVQLYEYRANERRLDEQIEASRRASVIELDRVRNQANQRGDHDLALAAANLAEMLRNVKLELDTAEAGTVLARTLHEAGRIADAAALVRAGAVADSALAESITGDYAWKSVEDLGDPGVVGGLLHERDDAFRLGEGRLSASAPGLVGWHSPRFRDVAVRGRLNAQAGTRFYVLLRVRRNADTLDSWYRVAVPIGEVQVEQGRTTNTFQGIERVEVRERRLRGAAQLDDPVATARPVEFEERVQEMTLSVWLNGELVLHLRDQRPLFEASGIGFAFEADDESRLDMSLRDLEYKPLRRE